MTHTNTIFSFILTLSLLMNFSTIAIYAENSDRDNHIIKNSNNIQSLKDLYVANNNHNYNYLEDLAIDDWVSLSFSFVSHLSIIIVCVLCVFTFFYYLYPFIELHST